MTNPKTRLTHQLTRCWSEAERHRNSHGAMSATSCEASYLDLQLIVPLTRTAVLLWPSPTLRQPSHQTSCR